MRAVKHDEEHLQIACVRWFRLQYPHIIIHHSPNGGKRGLLTAIRFKQMGTIAGFPDLFIAYPAKGFHGLFIEMKNGREGVVSQEQKRMLSALDGNGYKTIVVRSFDDFISAVNDYIRA
ncbi:MAG: VRR-NUC domain-containing protein [Bacteroidales bacterium]|nr:VRR-NUC domain-containing protein [Bacteroidales bacterium]